MIIVAILFYQFAQGIIFDFSIRSIGYLLIFSAVAAIVEGLTPKGLDNLTVPFIIGILFWYIFVG